MYILYQWRIMGELKRCPATTPPGRAEKYIKNVRKMSKMGPKTEGSPPGSRGRPPWSRFDPSRVSSRSAIVYATNYENVFKI
jgi:hypothetical protein